MHTRIVSFSHWEYIIICLGCVCFCVCVCKRRKTQPPAGKGERTPHTTRSKAKWENEWRQNEKYDEEEEEFRSWSVCYVNYIVWDSGSPIEDNNFGFSCVHMNLCVRCVEFLSHRILKLHHALAYFQRFISCWWLLLVSLGLFFFSSFFFFLFFLQLLLWCVRFFFAFFRICAVFRVIFFSLLLCRSKLQFAVIYTIWKSWVFFMPYHMC